MIIRQAKESDFGHLETFVWQAIFPAFDKPDLSAAQRAENDSLVETARETVLTALERRDTAVLVVIDPRSRNLAGYLIADAAPGAYAEISTLIVKRSYWGKGVAEKLMLEATSFIGRDRAVSLAVRHYNGRALAFFAKQDFVDTSETTGDHAIPRTLMLREAYEVLAPPPAKTEEPDKDEAWFNFPSADDEPVFEELPDYRLAVDETPLFQTGSNALTTSVDEFISPGETTLTEKQLTDMEAFIARARAKKGTPAPKEDGLPLYKPKPLRPAGKPREATIAASEPVLKSAPVPTSSPSRLKPAVKHNIPFEVDFGDGRVEMNDVATAETTPEQVTKTSPITSPSFEFAFGEESGSGAGTAVEQPGTLTETNTEMIPVPRPAKAKIEFSKTASLDKGSERKTKHCPDCTAELPAMARFCYGCGYPQPEEVTVAGIGEQAPEEDFLQLQDLPDEPIAADAETSGAVDAAGSTDQLALDEEPAVVKSGGTSPEPENQPTKDSGLADDSQPTADPKDKAKILSKSYASSELRQQFREHFQATILDYFGDRKLKTYYDRLETDTGFQQLRDGSLNNLLRWLNEGRPKAAAIRRIKETMADLTEYFIVETASDLSGNVLPQRLLRHQSVDWDTVDLFKLVMDYLDFGRENERVYTDFVTMPERALRNATRSFLQAGKDERIFLICDQSLISQAKNGFAVTDSGLYWKTVLQPAGVILFNTLEKIKLEQGHLKLDGQFFNAGASLNLKLALLLRKLGRM